MAGKMLFWTGLYVMHNNCKGKVNVAFCLRNCPWSSLIIHFSLHSCHILCLSCMSVSSFQPFRTFSFFVTFSSSSSQASMYLLRLCSSIYKASSMVTVIIIITNKYYYYILLAYQLIENTQ